ncbi:MAG: glycosyltransferase family 39 protein [Kiritimatiellae bacterium]|nr:glycosyltransferase family 39 protein [Kiritimatiellia bacterium]MDW8459074.1 glycosyltransferase family 39 protein [Verrucomicrobiota bacterium]
MIDFAALPWRRSALAWLLALGFALYFVRLGAPVMVREQELRVALTAREMVESGNWLEPRYLGEPRFRKPPLMYWAVAAGYLAAGRTDSAWLARAPSAAATLALAATLFAYARGIAGSRTASLGTILFLTTFIVLRQGRHAETDALLILWTSCAILCGFATLHRGLHLGWTAAAGLASGLGVLTKGPAALAIPALSWAVAVALSPYGRPPLQRTALHLLVWLFLSALLSAPWFLLIIRHPESPVQLRAELVALFTAETRHPGPWYYYFYTAFHALAPWSLVLPFALAASIRLARRRRIERESLAWFASAFLLLSLTPSKQIHYALLLAPPAALLAARWLARLRDRRFARIRTAALILVTAGALTFSLFLSTRYRPQQALADLLRAHRDSLRAAPSVLLVGRHRGTAEFHAGRPVRDIDNLPEALRLAQSGDWILLTATESALPDPPPRAERIGSAESRGFRAELWKIQ